MLAEVNVTLLLIKGQFITPSGQSARPLRHHWQRTEHGRSCPEHCTRLVLSAVATPKRQAITDNCTAARRTLASTVTASRVDYCNAVLYRVSAKSPVGSRWCWTLQPAWLLVRAGVTIFHQTCVMSSTGCRWPSGFSSRLRLLHYTASVAPVQPTSKTSAPQWSTRPVGQTSVRPIAVSCSSREPGHNSADEAFVLLLQMSGTVFLFICARHPSVADNSELGYKPISSAKPTSASENDLF